MTLATRTNGEEGDGRSVERHLERALDRTDDPEARFQLRSALQRLEIRHWE